MENENLEGKKSLEDAMSEIPKKKRSEGVKMISEKGDIERTICMAEALMQKRLEQEQSILECLQFLRYWQRKLDKLEERIQEYRKTSLTL